MLLPRCAIVLMTVVFGLTAVPGRGVDDDEQYVREHYTKHEFRIPVRDGIRLFTAVYVPDDRSCTHPIIMRRTPYSVSPYGLDRYPSSLGPSMQFARKGYIFVFQDVRGCYMSEGTFVNMTPHRDEKTSNGDVDESSDTYDTIEWLLANLEGHNGKVGLWGISYPGFYAAAGMIDSHPALRAVSPQAPIADWYFDDFHHHGAFFLPHSFNFLATFGRPRSEPTTDRNPRFDHKTPDGYQFFLELGSLANADRLHFKGDVAFWNEIASHPDRDDFWKKRDLLPHLGGVTSAVLTVGGWYDAEDLYGPLMIYRSVEARNPAITNLLVMGPWRHGGWSRDDGDSLGDADFGARTSLYYREEVELAFFEHHLRGEKDPGLAEATVFETGANRWRHFDAWPPSSTRQRRLHLRAGGVLSFSPPEEDEHDARDEFVSDPARPVPYQEKTAIGMTREYMTADQRFAARRPDVLVYSTDVLDDDVTLVGPLLAHLSVSTSREDADWVVKLVDVLPDDAEDPDPNPTGVRMGGYQMMVRSEVIRGRYRNGYDRPEPFAPDRAEIVQLPLQDVLHTFKRGHRIMVQVQSTWFPLVDRNPQKWVKNIFEAADDDFVKAVHRVYLGGESGSWLEVGELPRKDE
jgi:hypothetical protein